MQVKGSAVSPIPLFIKKKFGDAAHTAWIAALNPMAKKEFSSTILAGSWYPLKELFVEPMLKACELFYQCRLEGAAELGRFGAENTLKGIYKFFVKLGSPEFIAEKASAIFPTYYQPSAMTCVSKGNKTATVRITQFPEPHPVVEMRIKGWMERAIEISGARAPQVVVPCSMTTGAAYTDFIVTWQ